MKNRLILAVLAMMLLAGGCGSAPASAEADTPAQQEAPAQQAEPEGESVEIGTGVVTEWPGKYDRSKDHSRDISDEIVPYEDIDWPADHGAEDAERSFKVDELRLELERMPQDAPQEEIDAIQAEIDALQAEKLDYDMLQKEWEAEYSLSDLLEKFAMDNLVCINGDGTVTVVIRNIEWTEKQRRWVYDVVSYKTEIEKEKITVIAVSDWPED